jgi:hypothetical protein
MPTVWGHGLVGPRAEPLKYRYQIYIKEIVEIERLK